MMRKSRKLWSSFCEVDYCGERFQACRFAPSEQWFWWPLIKGFISRELSILSLGLRSVSETLIVSLFRTVYLFKNLERLNTV